MRRPRPDHRPVVTLAAAALSAALLDARPILLPFLYPSLTQQQEDNRGGSSSTRRRRSSGRRPTRSTSGSPSYFNPTAERLPQPFSVDGGQYQPRCWELLGLSNCPRDNDESNGDDGAARGGGAPDLSQGGSVVADDAIDLATTFASTSLTPTPTSTTPTTTLAAGTRTVKPYTMTFQVTNIPSGWQRNGRTHFYSKGMVIGLSVTLAILIILFIVGCVIWRVKAARVRRETEKILARKKAQIARGLAEAAGDDSVDYSTEDEQEREATRQRGIRRRRQNVRADSNAVQEKESPATFGSTSTTRRMWPRKWRARRRRNAKITPMEEHANFEEAETRLNASAGATESSEMSTTSEPRHDVPPIRPPSDLPASSPPIRLPPLSSPTSQAPAAAPDVHPPAYRRGTFGRPRLSTAPVTIPSRTGKERELALDVPEEYLCLPGVPPPPMDDRLVPATPAIRLSPLMPDSQPLVDNGEEDDVEEEDLTAHLATDDKAVLKRLGQIPSAPPQPASPSLAATAPHLTDVEDHLPYDDDDERHAGPSGAHALLPAPPPITSAHLFVPPSTMDLPVYIGTSAVLVLPEKQSELEVVPSAPPVASAPPLDDDALGPSAPPLEPSAPLLDDDASAPTYEP